MNKSDLKRNYPMLKGRFAKKGYDWWWHNFTAINEESGEEKSFFIEYFACNPALSNQNDSKEPILGQLKENQEKGLKPSYVMIKCGWWGDDATQLHYFIPWKDVKLSQGKNGFTLITKNFFAGESRLAGRVNITDAENHPEWMCNNGSMEWDLTVQKEIAFNVGYGAGSFFRLLTAFEMYWHAEGMKSKFSGTITANGKKYIVKPETSYGYSDKNWGADFTSPWVWLSSNDLVSTVTGRRLNNSVFDIGGGRPKAFGIALNRKLLSDFCYEGKSYEFNFSKFWTFCRTKFDCEVTDTQVIWHVRQETKSAIMETEITCEKSKMLLVNYEAPDGQKRHNQLWNGGTGTGKVKLYSKSKGKASLIDEVVANHVGCEWGEYC